jgi:hypothetical protein
MNDAVQQPITFAHETDEKFFNAQPNGVSRYEFRTMAMLGEMYHAGTCDEAGIKTGTAFVLAADYDALAAERNELRVDAERYRTMRASAMNTYYFGWSPTSPEEFDTGADGFVRQMVTP